MDVVHGLPASVAKMQAKAAQLAEELRAAKAQSTSSPTPNISMAATEVPGVSESAGISANNTASGLQQAVPLPQTPAVFRRLSQSNGLAAKNAATSSDIQQLAALQCQKLEAEVQLWKCKHLEAVKELDRRQESYMRREDQLKAQLAAFMQPQDMPEDEDPGGEAGNRDSAGAGDVGSGNTGGSTAHKAPKPATLQEMQEQVLHGLDDLLQRQRLQMRTEEAQQLRQFRSRLAEIEGQLQACKQAAAEHQGDWMEKTLTLREELARTQEIANKLDAMYKLAEEEAAHLRVQFRAQEDDRQHLVRQLIATKRESSRLQQEHTALQDELDAIMALALEAEAGEAAPLHAGGVSASMWAEMAQDSTASNVRRSRNSSLATAINEVVSKRGSSAVRHVVQGGGVLYRPATAGPGQQRQQAATQPVRPWSAAQLQQHRHAQPCSDAAGGSADSAAVAARMERYGHVIQKLQKLLESERRQLRQLRSNYTAELGRRNELQSLLLDSIQQAKEQYREAESACKAQHRQAVQRPLWAVKEQRPSSAAVTASRHSSTPPGSATISAGRSGKPAAGVSRPCTAVPAALWSAAARPGEYRPIDQATWKQLLNELLTKREVLELLFGRAFPDFLNESGEPYSDSTRQQPSEQLQQVTVSQMRQLWGTELQQHYKPATAHEMAGLGETSPTGSLHDRGMLDGGVSDTDREDGDGSRMQAEEAHAAAIAASFMPPQQPHQQQLCDEQLSTYGDDSPASTNGGVSIGSSYCGNDAIAGTSGVVAEQETVYTADAHVAASQDDQQQQLCRQQPNNGRLAPADIPLGCCSSPVMPSFPARQPLHHTIIRRPWSGAAQHFAVSDAAGSSRRPISAAASDNAAKVPRQTLTRPATAAGSLASVEKQGKPLAIGLLAKAAAGADTGQKRPDNSLVEVGSNQADGSLLSAGPGQPVTAGQWGTDAAKLSASFLSSR